MNEEEVIHELDALGNEAVPGSSAILTIDRLFDKSLGVTVWLGLGNGDSISAEAATIAEAIAQVRSELRNPQIPSPYKATIPGEVNAPDFIPQPADPYAGPGHVGPGTDDSGETAHTAPKPPPKRDGSNA